jgi:hypothetical protein
MWRGEFTLGYTEDGKRIRRKASGKRQEKIFGAGWQLNRLGATRRFFDSHDP